jgi:phenylacetate-coenzyme A ligase PaaK-like adenylate-forming protein
MQTDFFKSKIFQLSEPSDFDELALELFRFQYNNVKIYREFVDYLGISASRITNIHQIPFLPISFFKEKEVISTGSTPLKTFTSSATTGAQVSRHLLPDIELYERSFGKTFELFYGNPKEYRIIALLPGYLEREGSSLVYMANDLIQKSEHPDSGFFLRDTDRLLNVISKPTDRKTLLLGVSFALWDLAEKNVQLPDGTIVMETGGMKGRRKEVIREELHEILKDGLGVQEIHSEYGMTELLSQAYSRGRGVFESPPWMKVYIRDPEDPLTLFPEGKGGGVNVIDLANIYSCAFIATQDLGRKISENEFEILGRFDYSDVRGCNLMVL